MLELAVRTLLANDLEPEISQDSHHLIGLENGDAATHARGSNSDCLGADKFRFQARFTILQQQGHHFPKILLQLVKRFPLRVGAGKTGDKSHKESGLRTLFDNSREGMHARNNIISTTNRKRDKEQRKEERERQLTEGSCEAPAVSS
jgi:hypothetical protein